MGIFRIVALGLLAGLLAFQHVALSGCDPCSGREYRRYYGGFDGLEVRGQELYPTVPAAEDYLGTSTEEGEAGWNDLRTLATSPEESRCACEGMLELRLRPPYCQAGTSIYCGWVSMVQFVVGPKMLNETYEVQHVRPEDFDLIPPSPPAIYLNWREEGWGFPEYRSVSVVGAATVTSVDPLLISYSVTFLDDANNRREVSVIFAPVVTGPFCDGD
ncbi:MAG TPA: hypothetical protein PK668_09990 [Myxococcota bacterium]|nr:hypothetical protein [Myxococcota bacterium]HRY93504.1 hypothetical protein [Myxococcota bacterium]HSA21947.1 hypothetical protein [Myxococcota bacterium]